ncbi:MAG: Ig-like domain-containing protein [Bifidobacteriaceae bacterium]|nr:Ig-like domain-containing protein [Bifidobacteriaceae bacterium]
MTPDGGRFLNGGVVFFVNGSPYSGARFTARQRHLGQQIVQVVILQKYPQEGTTLACSPIFGYTPPVVVKAVGTVTAKPAASSVSTDTRLGVSVKVKAGGVPKPAGKISVVVDGTHALTKALDPSAKGSIQVKLPQLAKGKHTVTVSYVDATGKIQDTTAKPFTIRAR